MTIPINLVFEDQISEIIMKKILNHVDGFEVCNSYSGGGFGYIKSNIKGFNEASKYTPFFVLTDLDNLNCPAQLINDWIPKDQHSENFIFRIAIKEVESWILADIEGFSDYLGVSIANFNQEVESIEDPKSELIRLTKKSRSRQIKSDIIPLDQYAQIGPNYNDRLTDFIVNHWDVKRAEKRTKSLRSSVTRLNEFKNK